MRRGESEAPRLLLSNFIADSTSDAATAAFLVQFNELGLDLSEKAGRDEAVAEYPGSAGERNEAAIRPFIDVVVGNDHPTRRIIQSERLANSRRNLDANRFACRRRVGDWQENDETRCRSNIRGSDETSRTVLALLASGSRLAGP
jgi:hypothetical protein